MRGLIFILTVSVMAAEEDTSQASVDFWGSTFTLTCPKAYPNFPDSSKSSNESTYSKKDIDEKYYCSSGSNKKYHFYIKATVCENCYELNSTLVAGAIVMDLLLTGGIMIIIYQCAHKKTSGTVPSKSVPVKATGRSAGRPPPVPATDYEMLNPQTRSKDIYAGVQMNG